MTHAMTLTNVKMSDALNRKVTAQNKNVRLHGQIEPVIYKLATMYPTWTFTADSGGTSSDLNNVVITHIKVSCDGEPLGEIARRYESRDYQICVQNDRIAKTMERSPYFYKTKDPAKAVAKVKKYFGPLNLIEQVAKARKEAQEAVREADWAKGRELREARDKVERAARDYVLNDGFEVFMEFVKQNAPGQYEDLRMNREKALQAECDLDTINMVSRVLAGNAPGVVITRVGASYCTVATGGQPTIYTDQTLPEWMRGGFGMLKLIEPGQFITQTGQRATENTFVLIGEDLTTVSQGETK